MTTGGDGVPAPAEVPWARQPLRTEPPTTKRMRQMVDSLPAWEPLPPGEILVNRERSS